MWYNHAKAEAVFKQEWTQKEHICRENGMTDAQIQECMIWKWKSLTATAGFMNTVK